MLRCCHVQSRRYSGTPQNACVARSDNYSTRLYTTSEQVLGGSVQAAARTTPAQHKLLPLKSSVSDERHAFRARTFNDLAAA